VGDLDAVAELLVAGLEPRLVGGTGSAGDEVQEPGLNTSVLVTGQVDHPGQLLRTTPAVLDGLGRDVVPEVLIDAQGGDVVEAGLIRSGCLGRCPRGAI